MTAGSEGFYAELPEASAFSEVVDVRSHHDLPADWSVLITDVRGSTKAIEEGRYREVNALGVASIIAVKNATADLDLPFVFGGDGATLAFPLSRRDAVECALRGLREVAEGTFEMGLRTAHVPVELLVDAGHPVRVARLRQPESAAFAAFSGSGFSVAESWIKSAERGPRFEVSAAGPAEVDLEGFECRWRPVPAKRGHIVSLLVVAGGDEEGRDGACYRDVLDFLRELGALDDMPPYTEAQMRLRGLFDDYSVEAKMRSGKTDGPEYRAAHNRARNESAMGRALIFTGAKAGSFDGKVYRQDHLRNTDHRKFDEALRMVLDLPQSDIDKLEVRLEQWFSQGRIAYGLHSSGEALVTCAVGDYAKNHVHFVDGSDGGYAMASKPLKRRLRELADRSAPAQG